MDWDNEQERARFLTAFRALAELHNRDASKALTRLYHSTMAEHDIGSVLKAFRQAATKLRFFPKPVELLEFIEGSQEDAKVEAALEADAVLLAIRRYGVYANVRFLDPVTNAVVRQGFGGWLNVCRTRDEDVKWFIRDFVERYTQFKAAGVESTKEMRGIGTGARIELVGDQKYLALEGNHEGQKAVAGIVDALNDKKKLSAA
jgi:hypothetical protein